MRVVKRQQNSRGPMRRLGTSRCLFCVSRRSDSLRFEFLPVNLKSCSCIIFQVGEKSIRILIADDHEAVRRGLRSALAAAGWEVCADVMNGKDAVEKTAELKADLVILDISMPVMGGLDAARLIRTADPSAKIVIFTMHESQQVKDEIARVGAQGYAVKSAPMKQLLERMNPA
jgi:CheY-like chemotaxis protein